VKSKEASISRLSCQVELVETFEGKVIAFAQLRLTIEN